ncbi:hypothetical protein AVEN_215608-1 [Araneus ventricosus]|uniref:Uncharacterized protein n=1 Tax=Araneus ventricosus TaxID=182803 RepID=A0A4Y2TEE8_ARAVE|nr:hypothetical protein AVEN_215608-1 [Araneus ventricosus]
MNKVSLHGQLTVFSSNAIECTVVRGAVNSSRYVSICLNLCPSDILNDLSLTAWFTQCSWAPSDCSGFRFSHGKSVTVSPRWTTRIAAANEPIVHRRHKVSIRAISSCSAS